MYYCVVGDCCDVVVVGWLFCVVLGVLVDFVVWFFCVVGVCVVVCGC